MTNPYLKMEMDKTLNLEEYISKASELTAINPKHQKLVERLFIATRTVD